MRFLVDAMCGSLARYLRMCGHDAAYVLDRGLEADAAILEVAAEEDRTLLTRDRDLAAAAESSILLASRTIEDQLREVAAAGVELSLTEPARCGHCNGRLAAVDPGAETPDYAPDPAEESVWRCADCGQCFWRGSHWDDVARRLDSL